jgi:tRNA pseudouridine38-40 synthase
LEVEADGFLYNMVRTMVGTLVEVGRGRKPPEWAAEVLAGGNRREAGMKVPAHGLFMLHVTYAATPANGDASSTGSAEASSTADDDDFEPADAAKGAKRAERANE